MKRKKAVWILVAVLTMGIVVWMGGRWWILTKLKQRLVYHLENLRSDSVSVAYDTIRTGFLDGSIFVSGLKIKRDSGKHSPMQVAVERVGVTGIGVWSLLFKHELHVERVFIVRPSVVARDNKHWQNKRKPDGKLKGIYVDQFQIDSATVEIIDSTGQTLIKGRSNFLSSGMSIGFSGGSPAFSASDFIVSGIAVSLPTHFYSVTVEKATYTKKDKSLKIDSVHLEPTLSRLEFARRVGKQTDRFRGEVPSIEGAGFEIDLSEPYIHFSHISFQFNIEAFRDKRIARKYRKPSVLPAVFLSRLPFRVQVDSITLSNSYVSYEEVPENENTTGKIDFSNISAHIYNLSNQSANDAVMNVHSRFLKSGELVAHFTFPSDTKKPYTVHGSLSHFNVVELNSMLVPHAHAQVESGTIQELKFQFQYNDFRSDGEVDLSYDGLKVIRLRKNPEKTENKIVTFVISLFVKDHLGKADTKEKRTGTIQFERNTQRGILNYWWKSVSSGIKSVFGLEKVKH